jgi:hypothetical protein
MEQFKVRIVNRGLAGEPFHYCFQNEQTRQIIEFSEITHATVNGERVETSIEDSNLDNQHISDVLNKYGHVIDIQLTEEGGYELFFN